MNITLANTGASSPAVASDKNVIVSPTSLSTSSPITERNNKPRKNFILPELSSKEGYTCAAQSFSCLVYVSKEFIQNVSIETVIDLKLHPQLQANEMKLTPVVCICPQEQVFSISKAAIVELMKILEPNPNHDLVPLHSLSDPFEWKKLASPDFKILKDRIVFKTTHFGYFAAIAQFSLPTVSITIEPTVSQPAQLLIQELPGFKMEIPPTSGHSKTEIKATVHYDDLGLCGDENKHSPASACVMLEPHNAQFQDKIMITVPIPYYAQIKRDYPNIKLELWHIDNAKKHAPVKLKLAEEFSITIDQDSDGDYLATAYIDHFSGILYLWNAIVNYCLNLFTCSGRCRCQVFMSRETKHGSCITFEIAVLLYPFQDPYSSLPNYPYLLYDSVLPITLVAGVVECQIELDKFLLQSYQSLHDQQCYTKSCTLPKDFNMRVEFDIQLHATTAMGTALPAGKVGTLIIKQAHSGGCDPPPFTCILIKPPATNLEHDDTSFAPENSGLVQASTHPIELAACELIKTTAHLKEDIPVEAARRIAVHMKTIVQLACTPESDVESSTHILFDTIQSVTKESLEIDKMARKVAESCTVLGLKKSVLEVVDKIPAIAGQLRIVSMGMKMEAYSKETIVEAIDLLTHNAENLMHAVKEVLYATDRAVPTSDMERLNLVKKPEQAPSKPAIRPKPAFRSKPSIRAVTTSLSSNSSDEHSIANGGSSNPGATMADSGITLQEVATEAGIDKLDILNQECSQRMLLNLAKHCVDWRLIGLHLELTEADITAVNGNYLTVDGKRVGMLGRWKDKFSFKATYRVFIEALLACGRTEEAVQACQTIAEGVKFKHLTI